MVLGAMKRLHEAGLEVPADISIIGFDDIDVASQIIPPLTTISAPVKEIAERSFNMLEYLITGKTPENRHIALAVRLVIRQTSARLEEKMAIT